jgi:pimeloyl-ACP methyl ester carboxylesterase
MLLTLADGRDLDVVTHGTSGPALLFHHGTPWAAEQSPAWVEAAAAVGFRWVSVSRPGYGDSSRREGRSVADNNSDVTEVLDRLGVDRFVAAGWSGGGPHALACGARLAPRCAGVVLLAGVAPFTEAYDAGFDWLDGMGPENHAEFGAAGAGEAVLREFLAPEAEALRSVTGPEVGESLGGLVDEADLAVLTGEYAEHTAECFRTALRHGVDGWLDDDLAFVRPWGFTLADVCVPVAVWQGEQDRMVPYGHGPFQAVRLPDARTHLLPGEGHLSIVLGLFEQIVAEAATFVD